jgi:ribosomal protein S18 acetylase RimI-like enzyme
LFPDGVLAAADPMAKFERWQTWLDADSEFLTVVAERDGQAVGHTTIRGHELVHLFIDPKYQGQGLGADLLSIGESLLASAGHSSIMLQTLVGNERAISLYESRGWVVTDERIPGEWFGHKTEEHVLVKLLS